jgi:hypothetical protein
MGGAMRTLLALVNMVRVDVMPLLFPFLKAIVRRAKSNLNRILDSIWFPTNSRCRGSQPTDRSRLRRVLRIPMWPKVTRFGTWT